MGTTDTAMTGHQIVSRGEWTAARSGLTTIMNKFRCCEIAASNSRSEAVAPQSKGGRSQPRRLSVVRWRLNAAGWLVPGAILALMPKCPMCLAAYVAVWTGVGLSLSAAANLRLSLLILSVSALLCLAVRYLSRIAVAKADILKPQFTETPRDVHGTRSRKSVPVSRLTVRFHWFERCLHSCAPGSRDRTNFGQELPVVRSTSFSVQRSRSECQCTEWVCRQPSSRF